MAAGPSIQGIISPMYARWTLDSIVRLVEEITKDFQRRGRSYRNLQSGGTTGGSRLINFIAKVGHDPDWPSDGARAAIFQYIFGTSDENPTSDKSSQFHHLAQALRDSAVVYINTDPAQTAPALAVFTDRRAQLETYINSFAPPDGMIAVVNNITKKIYDEALVMLDDGKLQTIFGPGGIVLTGVIDTLAFGINEAGLIQAISRQIGLVEPIGADLFLAMQRVAIAGMAVLQNIAIPVAAPPPAVDPRITEVYTWHRALEGLAAIREHR